MTVVFDPADWLRLSREKRQTCALCGINEMIVYRTRNGRVCASCGACKCVLWLNAPRSIVGLSRIQQAVESWNPSHAAAMIQYDGGVIDA